MFNVMHRAPLDEEGVPAGVVALDAEHRLHVVSSEADFADALDLAAELLNSSDKFLIRAASPDEESRTVRKRVVPRDAADARAALFTALREKYGFELTPAG